VRGKYNRVNGYEADCDVIYGDTDSVMVNFKVRIHDMGVSVGVTLHTATLRASSAPVQRAAALCASNLHILSPRVEQHIDSNQPHGSCAM